MEKLDTYFTVKSIGEGIFKDRGSRFIARAYPVETEELVKEILIALRKEFYDARHHCYAYILGSDKNSYRVNDDGEPSGSAGKPIHGQLLSLNVTNVLVVVVRYFGGTKLGVPGLINAYKTAAREAIENAEIIEKSIDLTFKACFEYASMNSIMNFIKEENLKVIHTDFQLQCEIHFLVNRALNEKIAKKLNELRVLSKALIIF